LTLDRAALEDAEAMIRIVSACSIAASLCFAASDGRAAPAAKPNERSARPPTGLESADPAVRRAAISKLVADRDPTAVAQLALALEGDDDEAVRQAAASGLGELADKRGTATLRRCLQREPSQAVKRSCRVSLARLDPQAATMEPEPTATTATTATVPAASPVAPAATSAAATANQSFDLRIDVTAEDVVERPNHAYLELWSAINNNTLAVGFERVIGPHWTVAVEPQFSADSQSFNGAMASAVAVALAVRPHYYFLQQAPSGPYIAPFGSVGYSRVTFDFPSGFPQANEKVSGTVWAVGAGVGWSLVINARAVLKLSAVFSFTKAAATFSSSGVTSSSSSASFSPFASAGVMF
jgi:hypothetical protein